MEVIVTSSAHHAGLVAAERVAEVCRSTTRPVLGVATGSSPLATYQHLAGMVERGEIDLAGATAFALDEYVGLPANDPTSYADTIRRTVTGPLRLEPSRVHVPDGAAGDLDAAARRYEELIAAAGGVDVQVLGIGSNGHIGFNEPGTMPTARTHVVELTDRTLRDNARFFGGDPSRVPTRALTQGLGTILEARRLVMVATGPAKAAAVAAAVTGPVGPQCPASFLQAHPDVVLVLDQEAAAALPAGSAGFVAAAG